MHLLASYFPYEISAGQDGGWSFWNRHQYPVGVNLSEGDDRWHKLWDSYPPWRVELRGIGNAAVRALRIVTKIEFPGDGGLYTEANSTVTGTL